MRLLRNRKLNNKGFTLIELLAVIVILAIVMGISATSVLNSINSSRKSSLHSTAQNAANNLNTWISEDMIVTNNDEKKLGDAFVQTTQTGKWMCLKDLMIMNKKGSVSTKLSDALSLNEKDIDLISSSKPTDPSESSPTTGVPNVTGSAGGGTCSALRYNESTGGYELLLVAINGGKYYVSAGGYAAAGSNKNYAFSRASGPGIGITD